MQEPLQLGKLRGRTLAATSVPSPTHSRLFYVHDTNSCTHLLVDTGSAVSVIPPSTVDHRRIPDKLTLIAVNDTPIRTYGKQSLTLNLGLRRSLPWIFIVAEVQKPILGADFLRHFGLLVDMQQHQLHDAITHLHIQGIISADRSPSLTVWPRDPTNPYHTLLSEFPTLTQV